MSGLPMPVPVLGIDTCGPAGSVALSKVGVNSGSILGQAELEGRTYSATLVAAVERLLAGEGLALCQLGCIVVVNGPGSFTGVRVGLSAVKGLAFGAGLPIVALSRLEVLARISGCPSAALDAHRHELFLRLAQPEAAPVELLASRDDLLRYSGPGRVAVCDDPVAALLADAWPSADLVRVEPPTAADAIRTAATRIRAGDFDDLALLDGHYLRRSDAEIFGEKSRPAETGGSSVQ